MSAKLQNWILPALGLGVVAGGFLGYVTPDLMLALGFIGRLFVNILQIVAIPMLISGVLIAVISLGDLGRLNRIGLRGLAFFAATSIAAVIIALGLSIIIQPGASVNLALFPDLVPGPIAERGGLFGMPIPDNLSGALFEARLLGIVLFTFIFGAVIIGTKARDRSIYGLAEEIYHITIRLAGWLVLLTPLAVFSLVGDAVARQSVNFNALGSYLPYLLTVVLGFMLLAGAVYPLALKFFGGGNPIDHLRHLGPALLTAFGSSSSATAYPITHETVRNRTGLDSRAAALSLPLSITLQLAPTVLYLIVAAIFSAQATQTSLSIIQYILVVIVGLILSIGVAGLPSAAISVAAVLFTSVGFPQGAFSVLAILVVFDWILDRFRAMVNVWGDSIAVSILANSSDMKASSRPQLRERPQFVDRKERGQSRAERPYRSESQNRESRDARPDRGADRRYERGKGSRFPRQDRPADSSGSHGESIETNQASPFTMSVSDTPVFDLETKERKELGASGESSVVESPISQGQKSDIARRGGPRRFQNESRSAGPRAGSDERRYGRREYQKSSGETSDESGQAELSTNGGNDQPSEGEKRPRRYDRQGKFDRRSQGPRRNYQEREKIENDEDVSSGTSPTPIDLGLGEAPVKMSRPEEADNRNEQGYDGTFREDRDESENSDRYPSSYKKEFNRQSDSEQTERGSDERVRELSENTASEEVAFGRTRSHRGDASRDASSSNRNPEPPESEEATDSFSTEGADFGRGKRKRGQK